MAWGRYTSPVSGQLTGHDTAWSDPLVLTDGQMGTFGAMINLGAMAGACGVGAVADRLGRTRTLALSSVPFMLGCVLAYPRLKQPENPKGYFLAGGVLRALRSIRLGPVPAASSYVWCLISGNPNLS